MAVDHRWSRLAGHLLVERPRPDAVRSRQRSYWLVVGTVCVGAGMGQLDASIVTLGLPSLQRAFHATLGQVEWVALAYLVVLAAAVVAVGRYADMVGRKLLYIYGFALFTIASVACALAPTLPALDAFRAVQGLGAAMLQANSVALIAMAMPRDELGRGIGVQGAAQAVGLALGPTVGGALIALGGWRLIFLVNAPVGVVGIVLGTLLLPRSRDLAPRAGFDWPGLALCLPAVGALLAALSLGGRTGFTSTPILALFAVSGTAAAGFIIRERRAAAPMIDPDLFRRVAFSAGIGSGLLSYLVLFGVMFSVPFYLERVQHASPARAGLELTVLPVAIGLVAPFAGRLADRVGARAPTVVGMVVAAVGLVLAALVHPHIAVFLAELALVGIGLGTFTPANNAAVMATAAHRQAGMAGGALNMTRTVGTAFGVAVTGVVLGVTSGATGAAAGIGHGAMRDSLLVLACLATLAAGLAALRGRRRTGPASPTHVA